MTEKELNKKSGKKVIQNSYIQVLNLMYICDKDLSSAINKISTYKQPIICFKEKENFSFLWYVWGNDIKTLHDFKLRIGNVSANNHFYYHTENKSVVSIAPKLSEPARHTQGLSHQLVLPYIQNTL